MRLFGILVTVVAASLAISALVSARTATAANRLDVVSPQLGGVVQLDTGRVVVQFETTALAAERAALHRSFGATVIETIPVLGIDVVRLPNASATQAVAAAYDRHPLVSFAEPDALAPLADGSTLEPDDSLYGIQWQHVAVDSPGAWAVTTGAPVLRATVCDTGVEGTHTDLDDNLATGLGFNTVDNSNNWSPVHPHGTFVAGMIAAEGNNSNLVAGAAWNATIIPVRISNLSSGGAYFSDMAECILYGTDHQSTVINLSYQTYSSGRISPTILSAAEYANNSGSVLIVAAGNENTTPAKRGDKNPENIVYVSSIDEDLGKSSFSNYGAYIDIAAPGRDVVSTYLGNSYRSWSGTSFAAPLTAGSALLVANALDIAPNGPGDADCIRAALTSGAVDAGSPGEDDIFGAGILNSHSAVHYGGCGGGSAGPTATINKATGQADPTNATPISFTVVFSEDVTGFGAGDVTLTGSAGATTAEVSGSGTTYSVTVTGMAGDGTVTASIDAGVASSVATGAPNEASTSTDNTVIFDTTGPIVTLDQALGQADPTSASTINFTVVFSEAVIGFTAGDVNISGSAGANTAEVTGSGTTYNVAISGMTGDGTVIADIGAGIAVDAAGNANEGSTSFDNTVSYTAPSASRATVESITYAWSGGSDGKKHLTTTVAVTVGGRPIAGALVESTLFHDGGSSWNFSGTTDSAGQVSFKLLSAGSLGGCFNLDVTGLGGTATWDNTQPADLGACKN